MSRTSLSVVGVNHCDRSPDKCKERLLHESKISNDEAKRNETKMKTRRNLRLVVLKFFGEGALSGGIVGLERLQRHKVELAMVASVQQYYYYYYCYY